MISFCSKGGTLCFFFLLPKKQATQATQATPRAAYDEISKKQESVRSGEKSEAKAAYHLLRSPFLAQLELITRLENEFSEEDIVGKVSGYIERFSTSIILFEDIDKYLGALVDGNWVLGGYKVTRLILFGSLGN